MEWRFYAFSVLFTVVRMAGSPYDELAGKLGTAASTLRQSAYITKVSSSEDIHKTIASYISNSCESVGSPQLLNLYKINRKTEARFGRHVYRMLLWHGTSAACAGGIIANGFNLGTSGLFGGGIYFADRFVKSRAYVQPSASAAYLLLVEVDLGQMYKANNNHSEYKTPPVGFHSVKGQGKRIPTWRDNVKYQGTIIPCGATRDNPRHPSYLRSYNEYIVYDPNRLKVRFLVECTL